MCIRERFCSIDYQFPAEIKGDVLLQSGAFLRGLWFDNVIAVSYTHLDVYKRQDLQDQAAGFAYGWKKINALDGINGIQWHSWFDHLGDGVPLGLRKYSDEEYKGEAKPVWTTYQKAGTDEEDDYFKQYLERIGIKSWEGLIQDCLLYTS